MYISYSNIQGNIISSQCICICCTGITQAIRCHCYKSSSLGLPNPQCVFLNYVCHSDIGCYLRRYYSDHPKQIVQMWGCIPNEYNQINYTALFCGPSNTRTDAYDCCYTDFCNDNLSITLQMELETVTPSPSVYVTPKLQPHAGEPSARMTPKLHPHAGEPSAHSSGPHLHSSAYCMYLIVDCHQGFIQRGEA